MLWLTIAIKLGIRKIKPFTQDEKDAFISVLDGFNDLSDLSEHAKKMSNGIVVPKPGECFYTVNSYFPFD